MTQFTSLGSTPRTLATQPTQRDANPHVLMIDEKEPKRPQF